MRHGTSVLFFWYATTLWAMNWPAQTDWIPFRAKQIRIQQILAPDGSLINEQYWEDTIIGNSMGSLYKEMKGLHLATGMSLGSVKEIRNAPERVQYTVMEPQKTITIERTGARIPPQALKARRSPQLESKVYLGRNCVVLKTTEGASEILHDEELGLYLYHRREYVRPSGEKVLRIDRVVELQIGIEEPDPKIFMRPTIDGYTVIDRSK